MQESCREILLVDDNLADVRLIGYAFEESPADYHLNVVHDGEEALDFVFRQGTHIHAPQIDLVLLDLNLPIMSGDSVIRAIRAHPDTRLLPVVVFSSSGARKDVRQAYESHANCYIRKPLDLDGIFKAIESLKNFWFEVAELPSCVRQG
jgi:two-component system, chemotaxis family, response regulator Rcp1